MTPQEIYPERWGVSEFPTPAQIKRMIDAHVAGRNDEASALHRKLLPLFNSMFLTTNPIPVKYALNTIGFRVGNPRLPLVPCDAKTAAAVDYELADGTTTKVDVSVKQVNESVLPELGDELARSASEFDTVDGGRGAFLRRSGSRLGLRGGVHGICDGLGDTRLVAALKLAVLLRLHGLRCGFGEVAAVPLVGIAAGDLGAALD